MLNNKDTVQTEPMHHREITLADGRYMIFYTFGDSETEERKADIVSETKPHAADPASSTEHV
jgi:hypothetical protein